MGMKNLIGKLQDFVKDTKSPTGSTVDATGKNLDLSDFPVSHLYFFVVEDVLAQGLQHPTKPAWIAGGHPSVVEACGDQQGTLDLFGVVDGR